MPKKGYKQTDEHRKNSGKMKRGKTYEELYGEEKANKLRKNSSIRMTQNNPMSGKISSKKNKSWEEIYGEEKAKEMKRNIHDNFSGENNSNYGKQESKNRKIKISTTVKKRWNEGVYNTKERSRKLREARLKQINELGGFINQGLHETQILDELEKLYNYKIDRNFCICGYKPDGYIHELNICIEIDEKAHFDRYGNLKKKDIERQKDIEKELNCNFLRIMDTY